MKKKILLIILILIVNAFLLVELYNSVEFRKSLKKLKDDASIDYVIENNINRNRNVNRICEVIVDAYQNFDEFYISKLGENIFSSTFDAYSGKYILSKGMKKLSDCVVNSENVKNMDFEDKMKLKVLLHSNIKDVDDYDFGFIKFSMEEIERYIENNKVDVITERNEGGYFDVKCPNDHEKIVSVPNGKFAPTKYIEKYEYECFGDFMKLKYSYLRENPPLIFDENEKSYINISYKNNVLNFITLEEVKTLKYTEHYAFKYINNAVYVYELTGLSINPIVIYVK